jgi:hypothetical protein
MKVFLGLLKSFPFIFACVFLFFGAFMNGLIQQFVQRIADDRIHTNLNQKLQILSQIKNITDNSNQKIQIVELSQELFDLIRSNSSNETTVKKEILFDSGFYILPFLNFKNVGRISDYYLWTVVRNQFNLKKLGLTIIRVIFFGRFIFIVIRRIFFFLAILYTFRSLTIILTIVSFLFIDKASQSISKLQTSFGSECVCCNYFDHYLCQ